MMETPQVTCPLLDSTITFTTHTSTIHNHNHHELPGQSKHDCPIDDIDRKDIRSPVRHGRDAIRYVGRRRAGERVGQLMLFAVCRFNRYACSYLGTLCYQV